MAEPILIAEIGGSSSRWAWLPDGSTVEVFPKPGEALIGFNPSNGDALLFAKEVSSYFGSRAKNALTAARVVVYGAGCGSDDRKASMRDAIASVWKDAMIEVESDLLGAARGLCGTESGLVLILGTGMNVGYFADGGLHQPMPSLGYVLGDEGSGADIGRHVLQDAFYCRMPDHVRSALFGAQGPDLAQTIADIHRSAFPARALAARTALLAPHLNEPYVIELITLRFHALLEIISTFFNAEQRAQVFATGSVAWGFSELLSACLLDHGMELKVVERDPLLGLVGWHRQR